jgi:predicted RNA-binding protein associated with RNAse of E/G family
MDWALDVVVAPDMSEWRMKDEDELQEFADKGLFSAEWADQVRATAQTALKMLLAREAPFDVLWEDWRPDPGWGIPTLSEGA